MADEANSPELCSCQWCGGSFSKRRGQNRYCSKGCRRARDADCQRTRRSKIGVWVVGTEMACRDCGQIFVVPTRQRRRCEECQKAARNKTYRDSSEKHREKRLAIYRAYNAKRRADPAYQEKRRTLSRNYSRKKRQDPRHRLDHRISQLVRNSLPGGKGGKKWEELVGYSIADLMAHLERQFTRGMSWSNIGQWHVDHILPRAMFNYTSTDEVEFRACWALTNLRPLWSGENRKKSAKRIFLI